MVETRNNVMFQLTSEWISANQKWDGVSVGEEFNFSVQLAGGSEQKRSVAAFAMAIVQTAYSTKNKSGRGKKTIYYHQPLQKTGNIWKDPYRVLDIARRNLVLVWHAFDEISPSTTEHGVFLPVHPKTNLENFWPRVFLSVKSALLNNVQQKVKCRPHSTPATKICPTKDNVSDLSSNVFLMLYLLIYFQTFERIQKLYRRFLLQQ